MACNEIIQSNEYMDLLVAMDEIEQPFYPPACRQRISEEYEIWYYDRGGVPPLAVMEFTFSAIPKCFGLLDNGAMEESGIIRVQDQPALSLKGSGVILGFLDTGIDYTNPLFRKPDGSTRILSIWDQTQKTGVTPSFFDYGAEYEAKQINEALNSENPYEIVPQRDENGHGTYLASIACGNEDESLEFTGAAPLSDILIVKLKEAKQYLRDFYFIPENAPAYQENDIMAAVSWMNQIAAERNQPLVLCVGLGTNNGSHSGTSILSDYLNEIGALRKRAVVVACGNEANARHHFFGNSLERNEPRVVEISVEENMKGFYVELWAYAPELLAVALRSPTGELVPKIIPRSGGHQDYDFILEDTQISIDYRIVGRNRADQLIFIRFQNAAKGIWRIEVSPENVVTGQFHMWLPMTGMLEHDVIFLEPNPDTTLTIPSSARIPISVGGYDHRTGSIYLDSGRGFTADGVVKPDFTAPAVRVSGAGLRGNSVYDSGTSIAAAITAGACAQVMEWGVVRGKEPSMNSVEMKNMLIRGCMKNPDMIYPNRIWGYGRLNLYRSFENCVGLGR